MSALLNPPVGTTLLVERSTSTFLKGERWVLTTVLEPHRLVAVENPRGELVELGTGQLAQLIRNGSFAVLDANRVARDRQVVELKAASPLRSTVPQHDASELGLFRAVNEPRLL